MPILVFERFKAAQNPDDRPDEPTDDVSLVKGDLWETIEWDFAKPTRATRNHIDFDLKCDFRLPYLGYFNFPHPTDDAKNIEFEYELPALKIANYKAGKIMPEYFTEQLKKEWDDLPIERDFDFGPRIKLICKKDIVDALECNIYGMLYVYRPHKLRISNPV